MLAPCCAVSVAAIIAPATEKRTLLLLGRGGLFERGLKELRAVAVPTATAPLNLRLRMNSPPSRHAPPERPIRAIAGACGRACLFLSEQLSGSTDFESGFPNRVESCPPP